MNYIYIDDDAIDKSKDKVSGFISIPDLLGTLYKITGTGLALAISLKCKYNPSCCGLL